MRGPCAGLVLAPLPTGAWAFLTATVAVATKTLTFSQCFGAFSNDVIWLIVVSFFFARVTPHLLSSTHAEHGAKRSASCAKLTSERGLGKHSFTYSAGI